MKKKVLILGGAGFIGLGISRFIGESRDHEITLADILIPEQHDETFQRTVSKFTIKTIQGDFSKLDAFSLLEKEYDYVYMIASVVGVNKGIEEVKNRILF